MSLPDWVLPFKEPRTEIKRLKNRYYKYSVSYKYSPDRKRSIKITGPLLGRITEEDGFIPSSKNELRQKLTEMPTVDIKTYGIYALFENLLRAEIPELQKIFGKEKAEQLLSFALMRWAYQSPIKRVLNYQVHDFCSEKWCKDTLLSDKQITPLLRYFGENREMVAKYMRTLLPKGPAPADNFVMMDSTHVMSASENLSANAAGYNPSFDFGKQIRLMYMFSSEFRKPVYYRMINGNITDITSMSLCIKELGAKNVVFIADKGFYSEANISLLEAQGLKYVIPLRRNNPAIDYTKLAETGFKKKMHYFVYQKRIIWYYPYEAGGRKFVTFMDERLRVNEEEDYLQRIATQPDSYSEEAYFEKLTSFGTLTLAFDVDDLEEKTPVAPERLYALYKQRNEIEIMFDSYKNFLKADVLFMQDRHVCEGWLFANFIAMIAYYKLYDRLRNAALLKKESPRDIIELAKAVHQIKMQGVWHRSEIPKRVQKLFQKIGIDSLF
jgi:transposase